MSFLEKYTFKGINKDVHPQSLSTDGQRRLTPGNVFHVENGRLTSSEGNNKESVESILGNEERVNGNLPNGANKVVGVYENIEDYSLIYFMWNGDGNHSIHRYNGSSSTFELIVEWSGLNFSGKPLTGIGRAGENVYWTDGENPLRYINLAELYPVLNEKLASLYLHPPSRPATTTFGTDSSLPVNRMNEDSWQFTYRYVYNNGGLSRFAPYSVLMEAKDFPLSFDDSNNYIDVRVFIEDDIVTQLDKVEIFYRKNNSEVIYFFDEVLDPSISTFFDVRFDNSFTGYVVPQEETSRSDESIPVLSSALAYFKDRLFVNDSVVGRDVNEGNYTATVTKFSDAKRSGLQNKEGGSYSYGLKFTDGSGRNTLVKKIGSLQFDRLTPSFASDEEFSVNLTAKEYARVQVSGTAPIWATHAQVVMTGETSIGTYMQFVGYAAFLDNFNADGAKTPIAPGDPDFEEHVSSGRIYLNQKLGFRSDILHIFCPKNLPFEPEEGMFIRLASIANGEIAILKIAAFYGDAIEVFGQIPQVATAGQNWDTQNINTKLYCEVFTFSEQSKEQLFYEIGDRYVIPSNQQMNIDDILEGDTHILDDNSLIGGSAPIATRQGVYHDYDLRTVDDSDYGIADNWEDPIFAVIESQTPTSKQVHTAQDDLNVSVSTVTTITPDLTKIAWNQGRAFVLQEDNGVDQQPTRISFSDTFIQDSNINGVHNFDSSNRKNIPRELGPITKFLPIGGNVMLAIHERECSSLSIGEGFIKVGDNNFILQKTESVVGDERSLLGGFGTIFPETAQSFEGMGFFYDIYKGSIVKYTLNGLFPVSDYEMKNYFEQKSKQLIPYIGQINVIAGIDPYHKEYIITFPAIDNIPAETWAFNFVKNRWNSQYPYVPEMYSKLGNKLITFNQGRLYEHHRGATYNNFYGVQYDRKIIFYANPWVTKTKKLLNISIMAKELAKDSDPEYKVMVIRTPSGQETYLKLKHFERKEQTFYAQVLKDINSTADQGRVALLDGADMRDKYFEIEINTNLTTEALLHEVTTVMVESEYSR